MRPKRSKKNLGFCYTINMAESPGFLGCIKTRELKILAEKRQFLRIARKLSMAFCFAVALFAAPALADDPCKNLFNPNDLPTFTGDTSYGTIEGTSDGFKVTLTQPTQAAYEYFLNLPVEDGIVYSCDDTDGTVEKRDSLWYFIYSRYRTAPKPVGTEIYFHKVQKERGSTATTYQPYNPLCATCDGTVKERPNLANVPDITDITDYPVVNSALARAVAGLEVGKTYTLSADYRARYSGGAKFIRFVESSSSYILDTDNMANQTGARSSYTFTMTSAMKNIKSAWIYPGNDGTQWNETGYLKNIQIEEGSTATAYHPYGSTYCEPFIKIATTAYNDAAFAPVEAALESAVTTIKDVVANTIVQADAIQNLQDTKQTMPDASGTNGTCPRFRQCLLIETDDGTPQWFQIADPVHDLVLSLKNNEVNNAGETNSGSFAANSYDGTNGTTNSRYGKGYQAMLSQFPNSVYGSSVYSRQFADAGLSGGQYRELGDHEWAVTWDGDETGTPNSFLPGVIYGTSRCAKIPGSGAISPGTSDWNTIENSEPMNDLENIAEYYNCYCKMTAVGLDGMITPVRDSSQAPWVHVYASGTADYCASYCQANCTNFIQNSAWIRYLMMNWAVE